MRKFLRAFLKYGLLIMFGFLFGVVLLEFGVRMLGAKPETYLRKFSQYHPQLGWEKTPNIEGEFRRGDVNIFEKMNSKGLRDIEYAYTKPDNVFRILVLGDSFTEGYDVNFEFIFTELLERRLNSDSSDASRLKYEVINAGTGGYSTDQEYLFYQIEGYKYDPDIVLMMTYAANDIMYNVESHYGNYQKPRFVLVNDSLSLTNVPLQPPKQQESIKSLFRDMALYPIVLKLVLTKLPTLAEYLSRIGFVSKSTLEATKAISDTTSPRYPSSFSIFERHATDKVRDAWTITDALIGDLKASSSRHGAQLVLFSIPDRFQVYPESWENTKRSYRVNESIWDASLPDSMLTAIADKYDLPFLNMRKFLLNGGSINEKLYNGVHWNERGNRVAADFIFTELSNRGLLKK